MSAAVGCGGRTSVLGVAGEGAQAPPLELCNGVDDDADRKVDEGFRDEEARYVDDDHCGACGHACSTPLAQSNRVGCELLDGVPSCVAQSCVAGFAVSSNGRCVALGERLCMACEHDADCGSLPSARCVSISGVRRCSVGCEDGCPESFACADDDENGRRCMPVGGDCGCDPGESFSSACLLTGPGLARCAGHQTCRNGQLSECTADPEICDGTDNDCNGSIDEGFVDALGAYSLDTTNCGACGIDCALDAAAGVPLTCGGDPFAPSCVVQCPDAADGTQLGDQLDADLSISTGCECTVISVLDASSDPNSGAQLDANCDGADGHVLESFYVATDGDDTAPGSPTRPLRTISRAVALSAASLDSALPRPDVYVASGTYTETVHMLDGVALHGGYRRDFLARNPDGFEVLVVAPSGSDGTFGAALEIRNAGARPTLVEGFRLRGVDADQAGEPAVGVYIQDPHAALTLRSLRVEPGKPGAGASGSEGRAGATPSKKPGAGEAQRGAIEDGSHGCIVGTQNIVKGGAAGKNVCESVDVSGGRGASPVCPTDDWSLAPTGEPGFGTGAGPGGTGGVDVIGPITGGSSCPRPPCCGLADFYVPGSYPQAIPGGDGASGIDGLAGAACVDSVGVFTASETGSSWTPGVASAGSLGAAGGGGGGGGAGGGAAMTWFSNSCEFADGIGGAGGGGGAGGCGGRGGDAGMAAGPAIGMLVRLSSRSQLPVIEGVQIVVATGASGGDGGAGGDGASGSNGGSGGQLPLEMLSTPTLAGAAPGAGGGHGGAGGAGGAGGGGCGGSSIGLWVSGIGFDAAVLDQLRNDNTISVGAGGPPGLGGSGAVPAAAGRRGVAQDVVVKN